MFGRRSPAGPERQVARSRAANGGALRLWFHLEEAPKGGEGGWLLPNERVPPDTALAIIQALGDKPMVSVDAVWPRLDGGYAILRFTARAGRTDTTVSLLAPGRRFAGRDEAEAALTAIAATAGERVAA